MTDSLTKTETYMHKYTELKITKNDNLQSMVIILKPVYNLKKWVCKLYGTQSELNKVTYKTYK